MTDNFQTKILLKEISVIREQIKNYDKFLLIIKGWAITLWTGVWLWLLTQQGNIGYTVNLILFFALLFFWFIDTLFKYYQTAFFVRDRQIEDNIENYLNYYKNIEKHKPNELSLYSPTGKGQKVKKKNIINMISYGGVFYYVM